MNTQPNAKPLTRNEKELIGLLYSCPLGEPTSNCVLYQIRNGIKSNYHNAINCFEKEKIPELLSEHKNCLVKRYRNNGNEFKLKNHCKLHPEIAYLKWNDKVHIGFLTFGIKKRKWIKSQSEFARLFDNTDIKHKMHCNIQYIYEFAYLLFRLKKENFFYTVNSKGYFNIIEQHILDYSEKSLSKNTLKYISSKTCRMPVKYHVIIKEVEEIINELTNISNNY
jgi:hypothetical protein